MKKIEKTLLKFEMKFSFLEFENNLAIPPKRNEKN
jgi:hypothetical protein